MTPPTIPTSPVALGFPEAFDCWREPQLDALRKLLSSPKRIKALCAPTGFGKTLLYLAYAVLSKLPTCFVTDNLALQDQLMAIGQKIGLVDVRGRKHYTCGYRPDYTCDMGYAAGCPHKGSHSCPSSQAEMRAAVSLRVVTNYDKWIAAKKYGTGMDHFTQVVFDEGHVAPDKLERAMQVTLSSRETDLLEIDFPEHTEDFVDWKAWANAIARPAADLKYMHARSVLQQHPERSSYARTYLHLKNLRRRINIMALASPTNWIADTTDKGYVFDPIRAGRYGEAMLLMRTPSVVIISATLRPKTLFQLGIPRDAFDYWEYPSDFDPKRCPIYYIPTMRVDSKAGDYRPLWVKHDQIAGARSDRKAIVHTVSYARQKEAWQESRYSNRMLLNNQGEAAVEIVEQFKVSPKGTILVSPSVGAGFDFPGRACEWQLLLKIPFPNGHTKIHQARQEDDAEYGANIAMNKMVQTFGRGMRSREDRCENFIVDAHLDWFLPRFRHLAPKWFHGFFKTVSYVPPPPSAL